MSDYEVSLRQVFPALYRAALRLGYGEEAAAMAAQQAFIEAYTEWDGTSAVDSAFTGRGVT